MQIGSPGDALRFRREYRFYTSALGNFRFQQHRCFIASGPSFFARDIIDYRNLPDYRLIVYRGTIYIPIRAQPNSTRSSSHTPSVQTMAFDHASPPTDYGSTTHFGTNRVSQVA
jgi:hypothetical protein